MMEFACAERNTPGVGRRVGIGDEKSNHLLTSR